MTRYVVEGDPQHIKLCALIIEEADTTDLVGSSDRRLQFETKNERAAEKLQEIVPDLTVEESVPHEPL